MEPANKAKGSVDIEFIRERMKQKKKPPVTRTGSLRRRTLRPQRRRLLSVSGPSFGGGGTLLLLHQNTVPVPGGSFQGVGISEGPVLSASLC